MTLPVSSYEELLIRVRNLTHETLQLRRELSCSLSEPPLAWNSNSSHTDCPGSTLTSYSYSAERPHANGNGNQEFLVSDFQKLTLTGESDLAYFNKENGEEDEEIKEMDEKPSPDYFRPRGEWGPESLGLWHSGPSSLTFGRSLPQNQRQETESVMSFCSSNGSTLGTNFGNDISRRTYSHQQLGAKVEMVYNLLSMLGTSDRDEMSRTLLAMSSSVESCQAMRQSGCLPLLIQLIHGSELDLVVRTRASEALQNIVNAQTDEKRRRRETRVLKFLNAVRDHSNLLKTEPERVSCEQHPSQSVAALMKYSFDADHRQAMCVLGGLHALAELIELEHEAHGSTTTNQHCIILRRYSGMALTNLTFGDGANKALLCSIDRFMHALISQLESPSEELRQVTASVIRNLSWRADPASKARLRQAQAVPALTNAAMRQPQAEGTLKSILSALWNLSAHCSANKVDICSVPGALAFLVRTLRYKSSTTLGIIENAGGILRNISSHIAVREDYRQILRDENCFDILLEHLKSPSLTVVSNACGTLWNLSARCAEDQQKLWDMGATTMLRSLVQSKHKMISMGSSAALKNLLAANPDGAMLGHLDATARGLGLKNLPSLSERKQRALEQELNKNLAETCGNVEQLNAPKRSDSHESVTSTQSDSIYERLSRKSSNSNVRILDRKETTLHDSLSDTGDNHQKKATEARLLRRVKTSMIPQPAHRNTNKNVEQKHPETTASVPVSKLRGIPVLKSRSKLPTAEMTATPSYAEEEFEEDTTECPVNYSLQYSESEETAGNTSKASSKSHMDEIDGAFYAETDLDQPTDFSLKYGEDDEPPDTRLGYYDAAKEEDTTRTYYTEGTPYEGTPYTFSSANSMSDLRAVASSDNEKNGNSKEFDKADEPKVNEPRNLIHNAKEIRDFGSGVSTPERPVQYCEEGTPAGCFSRFSSLSSLNGSKESQKVSPEKPKEPPVTHANTSAKKLVTFTPTPLSITDTPLMFSRSSSIASLGSCMGQVDADNDGNSSVVSAFSRLTSGLVSPSELPDSPTQTVVGGEVQVMRMKGSSQVFEDAMVSYNVEGTPAAGLSGGSSLSRLICEEMSSESSINTELKNQKVPDLLPAVGEEDKDKLDILSVSEVDESILADCISIGMASAEPKPRKLRFQTGSEDTIQTYHTEDTPANNSNLGSNSDLSLLTVPSVLGADDASSAGSDADVSIGLLNECINSGMPQTKCTKPATARRDVLVPEVGQFLRRKVSYEDTNQRKSDSSAAKDEISTFATENSPCVFSTRSSLSDLTIHSLEGSSTPVANEDRPSPVVAVSRTAPAPSPNSTNNLDISGGGDQPKVDWEYLRSIHGDTSFGSTEGALAPNVSGEIITTRSRQPSISSLSVESFDSCEPTPLEQALLEQCIHSGMPHKSKNGSGTSVALPAADEKNVAGNFGNEIMTGSLGTHTWSDESSSLVENSNSAVDGGTGLQIVDEQLEKPDFRIGLPTTIKHDAAIICRELKRIQEMDMQSLSSELSMPSYGSLLDGDLAKDSEGHTLTLKLLRVRDNPPSIPSLEPLLTLGDLDLENSMMSVASIVSEVAESPTLEGSDPETVEDDSSQKSLTLHDDQQVINNNNNNNHKRITPKERRRQTQDRYRTYTVEELKNKCTTELQDEEGGPRTLSTAQRYELFTNATLVTRTLENAMAEQEAESIDTNTYINEMNYQLRADSSREEEDEQTIGLEPEVKGPRILKPGDQSTKQIEEEGPGIRGRRKPLYSATRSSRSASNSNDASPKALKPKFGTELQKTVSEPSPVRISAPQPLCREGTFTKEEKGNSVKALRQELPPRIPRPTKSALPVSATSSTISKISQSRPRPASIPNRQTTSPTASHKRNASAGSQGSKQQIPSSTLKNSLSNQSLGKSAGKASTTVHNKSSEERSKTPKKEATSKIANLWKKVEESKKKQKDVKDERVWIGGSSLSGCSSAMPQEEFIVEHVEIVDLHKSKEIEENLVIEKEEVLELHSESLIPKSSLQIHAASSSQLRETKSNEGKSVVSAIVPPFNYNPPVKKEGKIREPVQLAYQKVTSV